MSTSSDWFHCTNLLFVCVIFCGREIIIDHLFVIHRSFIGLCEWFADWNWGISSAAASSSRMLLGGVLDSPPISCQRKSLLSASFCCSSDNCHLTRDCWRVSHSELSLFLRVPRMIFRALCSVSVTSSYSDISFVLFRDRFYRGSIKLSYLSSPSRMFLW